jgi:hypothetical protein
MSADLAALFTGTVSGVSTEDFVTKVAGTVGL